MVEPPRTVLFGFSFHVSDLEFFLREQLLFLPRLRPHLTMISAPTCESSLYLPAGFLVSFLIHLRSALGTGTSRDSLPVSHHFFSRPFLRFLSSQGVLGDAELSFMLSRSVDRRESGRFVLLEGSLSRRDLSRVDSHQHGFLQRKRR